MPATKTKPKKTPKTGTTNRTMIALWGISNQGKTTTIRHVFEYLRNHYPCPDPGEAHGKEVRGAILLIDGVKVGFVSSEP